MVEEDQQQLACTFNHFDLSQFDRAAKFFFNGQDDHIRRYTGPRFDPTGCHFFLDLAMQAAFHPYPQKTIILIIGYAANDPFVLKDILNSLKDMAQL